MLKSHIPIVILPLRINTCFFVSKEFGSALYNKAIAADHRPLQFSQDQIASEIYSWPAE